MRVRKIDHVAIAVHSIAEAATLFIDAMGAEFLWGGDHPEEGRRAAQLRLGGFKIELLEPLGEDSYLHEFLARHGQGFHHLTIYVEDLEEAIAALESGGFEVVDTRGVLGDWKETYVRPRSGFGTLLQIVETTGEPAAFEGITIDDVVAGMVVWDGWQPVLRAPEG